MADSTGEARPRQPSPRRPPAAAVSAYREHDRIVVVDDRADMIAASVDRWLDAHRAGSVPVLLAGTNDVVAALNHAVRERLLNDGILATDLDGLAVGERLVMRVNDYRARTINGDDTAVLNGQTGTLLAIDDSGLVVRLDHDDSLVRIGNDYVTAGGIDHAYATTAHRAQGGTWDLAIAVGLDGLYREAGYLVMSRGRQSNWLVLTQPELDSLDPDVGRHDSPLRLLAEATETIDDLLHDRLSASRAKALAITRDSHAPEIHHKATTLDLSSLKRWAAYARVVEARATHLADGSPLPQGAPPPTPFLTGAERSILERITDPAWEGPRRIEQERIPLDTARRELVQALGVLHGPTMSAGCQHHYLAPSPTSTDDGADGSLKSPA